MAKVGFIGLGKLGLACAQVMATKHTVTGYDIAPRTSDSVTVVDDIALAVKDQDIVFVAVQTPHSKEYDGSQPCTHLEPVDFDYSTVTTVLSEINKHATKEQLVVLISTCLPGTTRRELINCIPNARFIYNPYLIAMGSVEWDMVNPEMIIIGTEDGSTTTDAKILVDFYNTIMENNPRYEIGTWDEAEAIKIFYNTFISAKVGLANMIQDVAIKSGNIDVDVVTSALARSTTRIMSPKYMKAGMGDAGPCVLGNFPVTVNGTKITIEELYATIDYAKTNLAESANYACTARDEKKIDIVTCREYTGDIYKITTVDGDVLEVTDNHLVPVMRENKRIIVPACEILETDKLYKL